MDLYLLGAGASKSYEASKTKQKLPLANDFFKTFSELDISANGWVLIGDLINYVREHRGVSVSEFNQYNEDIEKLHTEIQLLYLDAVSRDDILDIHAYGKAHDQLTMLFCSVINEVQNGDESEFHKNLALRLNDGDVVVTFNWDTLIDKSLRNNRNWSVEDGYYVNPRKIYRNGWKSGKNSGTNNYLLKLHGSTNWISSYIRYDPRSKKLEFEHSGDPGMLYVYESTIEPYPCYDGRYMEGYEDFTMGYYPPNIPSYEDQRTIQQGFMASQFIPRNGINPEGRSSKEGIISMPVIIPPVLNKSYEFYGDLFPTIWNKAEDAIVEADNIYILGYSFPQTDVPSSDLFRLAFCKRNTIPNVVIVNPFPDDIVHKFKMEFGVPGENIIVHKEYITANYRLP